MPEIWNRVLGGKPLLLEELKYAASELLKACGSVKIWVISGDLGAGKTTLIKALGAALGVVGTMSSPTFSIINEYDTANGEKVFHFDFYRLKREQEALDIGVEEYLDSGNFCFIEWADRIPSLIQGARVLIKIQQGTGVENRIIDYHIAGEND